MAVFSDCVVYENVKCCIKIDGFIYLTVESGSGSVEIILNPCQAKLLSEALNSAMGKVSIKDLAAYSSDLYGDLETEYELPEKEEEVINGFNSKDSIGSTSGSNICSAGKDSGKEIKVA